MATKKGGKGTKKVAAKKGGGGYGRHPKGPKTAKKR